MSSSKERGSCKLDSFVMLLFELSVKTVFAALIDAIEQNKDKNIKINMKYFLLNKI